MRISILVSFCSDISTLLHSKRWMLTKRLRLYREIANLPESLSHSRTALSPSHPGLGVQVDTPLPSLLQDGGIVLHCSLEGISQDAVLVGLSLRHKSETNFLKQFIIAPSLPILELYNDVNLHTCCLYILNKAS